MVTKTRLELQSLWDPAKAPKDRVDEFVYASNLLGSDPQITNFGGGNTSSKVKMEDPLTGERVAVMWVKGSGGDLGTATRAGFASLYLDKVLGLERRYREQPMHEDAIVPLYPQCVFNLNPAAPSIDTPLHAFVPHAAVSHMHPDAVIAIAASKDSRELTERIWGDAMGFLPWARPGFELGLALRDLIQANPNIKGALMESHGFICWADDWKTCYELTVRMINQASAYIESKMGDDHSFGAEVRPKSTANVREAWLELLPTLRGKVGFKGQRLIASVNSSDPVLEFLSRAKLEELSKLGTSCPDHFLRTKIRPLVLESTDLAGIDSALDSFRNGYAAYYGRCRREDSPGMRNPNPSVVLIPSLGMVSFGKNPAEARITGEFYRNAVNVMRGAETVSKYVALPEQEAFNIEYWLLEEAKLKRMPPEKEFARQIAVVTGAAQGIGRATAIKLASQGASVVMLDINEERLGEAAEEAIGAAGSKDHVRSFRCDVTDKLSLDAAFDETILAFGGVDVVVVNAGNARRGTVAATSDHDYGFLSDLLMKAYFDTMAAATRLMVRQGTGGSIVVVGSKNGVAVGSNAALYSAAKAFELHLMRTVAVDFAQHGIRSNAINPDAVLQGSGIWSDEWREQTAASLGIRPDELQDYYRKRTMLGVTVSADDCAEAICWLASEKRASRTTGAVIPVDGGVREGFLR